MRFESRPESHGETPEPIERWPDHDERVVDDPDPLERLFGWPTRGLLGVPPDRGSGEAADEVWNADAVNRVADPPGPAEMRGERPDRVELPDGRERVVNPNRPTRFGWSSTAIVPPSDRGFNKAADRIDAEGATERGADRPGLAERLVEEAFASLGWKMAEVTVDAAVPGAGVMVEVAHRLARVAEVFNSVESGRGFEVRIPMVVRPDTGLSIDLHLAFEDLEQRRGSPLYVDLHLDPIDAPTPGHPVLTELPAPSAADGSDRGAVPPDGVVLIASSADVAAEGDTVGGREIVRYVGRLRGRRPYMVVYVDPLTRHGLVVIDADGDGPYCPVMFRVPDSSAEFESGRLWRVSTQGR